MIEPSEPMENCWRCGAPADPSDAYTVKLFAEARKQLDAFGQPVTRGRRLDIVRVQAPRCATCKARTRTSIVIVFGAAIVGAILARPLRRALFPDFRMPAWLLDSDRGRVHSVGFLSTEAALGALSGFVLALLAVAVVSRARKLRSVTSYPKILALRNHGWRLDAD